LTTERPVLPRRLCTIRVNLCVLFLSPYSTPLWLRFSDSTREFVERLRPLEREDPARLFVDPEFRVPAIPLILQVGQEFEAVVDNLVHQLRAVHALVVGHSDVIDMRTANAVDAAMDVDH
jgi:hypothetical protein